MKLVLGAIAIALCAQASAAEEGHFLPSDRVRYRLDAKADWQMGMFQSISAHGLVFAANADAPLDTLPLVALNAVELDRGKHVVGGRVLFFTIVGFFAGGLIGAAATPDCIGECWMPDFRPLLIGVGVGSAMGASLGFIPVRKWERVHGESEGRSNAWPSSSLIVKHRF